MKNVPNRTKIVQGNKKCASVAHYGIEMLCLPCMAFVDLYGLMWPRMALMLLFTAMAVCGLIRISMALYGLVWPCMALHGLAWPCMALNGIVWSFIAEYRLFSRSWIQIHLVLFFLDVVSLLYVPAT